MKTYSVKFCEGSRRELWVQEGKDRNNITINFLTCTGNFWWVVVDTNVLWYLSSVQFSSAAQSCRTLCDPMNCNTPGLPVHYQLPEFTQTHVHQVGDAIQPSHPLSSPFPPAPNPSQHQSLFQWVNSSHEVANYHHAIPPIDHIQKKSVFMSTLKIRKIFTEAYS